MTVTCNSNQRAELLAPEKRERGEREGERAMRDAVGVGSPAIFAEDNFQI